MGREGTRIDVVGLTKTFGGFKAVDDLSFAVEPGVVTGFLGPNGAGKTTTLRCLLGLIAPTAGTATIGGSRYRDLTDPIGTVGAALEASSFHPGRSARAHLRVMATAAGLPVERADAALAQVGLTEVGDKRVSGYSLGMRQRLGLAAALLGDPQVLILDEPANGLDPAGIAWLRGFLRALAGEGRTVLISSHVLSEVQQTVEDVVVLSRGRLVKQGRLADLDGGAHAVLVRTPQPERLRTVLEEASLTVAAGDDDGQLRVLGGTAADIGHAAFVGGVELHQLSEEAGDLERTFLEMTDSGDDEHGAMAGVGSGAGAGTGAGEGTR